MLADCTAIARRSRVAVAIRFASASIIRCRSAHLVEVRSNLRLPRHYSMRRAQQCRYFASSLPPGKRHSRLTTVRRGCCQVATRRDSWRSHVHRTRFRRLSSSSRLRLPMSGVEGYSPRLSLGDSMGVFSSEREYPLWCRGAHAALPPAPCAGNSLTRWANQKSATFLKNPLDKWAPRAIMQPTSEELQTYDGEK